MGRSDKVAQLYVVGGALTVVDRSNGSKQPDYDS